MNSRFQVESVFLEGGNPQTGFDTLRLAGMKEQSSSLHSEDDNLIKRFWGPLSSTIDWCEENYVVTPYIAEFVNTVTNLVFIILALSSLRSILKQRLEKRCILTSIGFALVGFGSWLFHMTLRYEYQLLDELPMIYTTLIVFWSLFSSKETQVAMGAAVFLLGTGITGWYLHSRNPIFHQVVFALLMIITSSRVLLTMTFKLRDPNKEASKTAIYGALSFLIGSLFWTIDNEFCSSLIRIRRKLGMPWAFLLEFHGWWHCLTGYGTYNLLVVFQYERIQSQGLGEDYVINWNYRILPTLVRREKSG